MINTASVAALDHGSWIQLVDLLIAFVLTSMIGLERELRAKSAGLRTHTIVGIGAALFVLLSKYGFADVLGLDNVGLDPSRVAAQIVSGIGFIGGGLIFVKGDAVRGLTTAATVWMAAAVGAAAGAGMWLIAIAATILHLTVVFGVRAIERRLPNSATAASSLDVTYEVGAGAFGKALEMLTGAGFTVARVVVSAPSEDERQARLDVSGEGSMVDLAAAIEEIPGVLGVGAVDANADIE